MTDDVQLVQSENVEDMSPKECAALVRRLRAQIRVEQKKRARLGLTFETPNNRREKQEDEVRAGKREKVEKWDENIADIVRNNVPFLKKRDDKSFITNSENPTHTLIKGDNFPALLALIPEYKNKVDVIYIDPPYNTGNRDFIYNDRYVNKEDGYRHSAWLSFMARRLLLAKEMLSDDGVIFVSIDDNEQAHLKILMDEIFGAGNFVGDFIRKTRTASSDARSGVNIQHESCLTYAKEIGNVFLTGKEKDISRYLNPDNDPRGAWIPRDPSAASGTTKNIFPVVNPYTGKEDFPPNGRYWAFSEKTIQGHIESGKISFKKKHDSKERGFIYKGYLEEMKSKAAMMNSLDFANTDYINSSGTKEVRSILDVGFTAPKPVSFVKSLVFSHPKKSATVLDFFAGSGTTGHAVAELNNEDGGTRKCILVTDSGKTGNAHNADMSGDDDDSADIADDITYERMRRVLTGKDWANLDKATALNQNLEMLEVGFFANKTVSGRDGRQIALTDLEIMMELEDKFEDLGFDTEEAEMYAQRLYNRWMKFADNEKGDLAQWD